MNKIAMFEKVSFKNYKNIINLMNNNADVKVKYIDYDDIVIPKRKTEFSAGYDFSITRGIQLFTNQSIVIPTFIRCYIEPGWDLNVYPRSGLGFKFRLRLANTIGVIDSDYYLTKSEGLDNEGHIMIKIVNEGNDIIRLNAGDRFCQGIFRMFGICYNDDEYEKDIRNGGIGSTGI